MCIYKLYFIFNMQVTNNAISKITLFGHLHLRFLMNSNIINVGTIDRYFFL